jgi:hypothetical protein
MNAGQKAIAALRALSKCAHFSLEDCVYDVRERECLGWDGPAVKAFSDACMLAAEALNDAVTEGI